MKISCTHYDMMVHVMYAKSISAQVVSLGTNHIYVSAPLSYSFDELLNLNFLSASIGQPRNVDHF